MKNLDRISDLPSDITDIILSELSIRDAVRTCVLSTSWRYRWTSIPRLVFDNRSFSRMETNRAACFITSVLLRHKGSLQTFLLSISDLDLFRLASLWIYLASRKDVRELVVKLGGGPEWFNISLETLCCNNLTHLELSRCTFHVSANFKGFLHLKYLRLREAAFFGRAVERLLSGCPLLESLEFSRFVDVYGVFENDERGLKVHGQNLVCLSVEGLFNSICLANTPSLTDVLVNISFDFNIPNANSSKCNYHAFFESIPKLERLILGFHFIKYLCIGIHGLNCSGNHTLDAVANQHLCYMELSGVKFDEAGQVLGVCQMLRNSRNLRYLKIRCVDVDPQLAPENEAPLQIWDDDTMSFAQLKEMEFLDVNDVPNEAKFIKFIVLRSPNLEKVRVSLDAEKFTTATRHHFCSDLQSFQIAYSKASISIEDSFEYFF